MQIQAAPNPSTSSFRVVVESSNVNEWIKLIVALMPANSKFILVMKMVYEVAQKRVLCKLHEKDASERDLS